MKRRRRVIKYEWQGEQVDVAFGYCVVGENKEKPLYWYNYNVIRTGQGFANINAIKVTTKDRQSFCLSNDFGEGVYKLHNGGYPNIPHRSLPLDTFIHSNDFRHKRTIYHPVDERTEELHRRQYFSRAHPEEFKKSEALRNMILRANKKYNV